MAITKRWRLQLTLTKVENPIGSEFYIQIGRDKGQVEFESNYVLHLETEEILSKDFEWKNNGDSLELAISFKDFGKYSGLFKVGKTIGVSAFQWGWSQRLGNRLDRISRI